MSWHGSPESSSGVQDALDASADGLVVVLVAGDPGVGKTALAQAFAQHCRGRVIPVHWGACSEIGGAPAFWPWVQVLRSIGAEALIAAEAGLDAHADQPLRSTRCTRSCAGGPPSAGCWCSTICIGPTCHRCICCVT